ncbi:queuosine biosynthesis protein QueC [Halospina denitrificans]|uniref:Queuosine biosynthesis protein QueC n=1 Tax=Halospina denitrificans TaxID=332522 RepID=A0A4R7JNQ6_9GAMM|nr:queuosine biosynthesis protein QueC [Halospina denitrificans]
MDVLWTGGWDSTFRILQHLFEGRDVKPHYILDPGRPSTKREIKAMKDLREQFNADHRLGGRLHETRMVKKCSFPEDARIREAYQDLIRIRYIGEQYKWIAEYCKYFDLRRIEVSVLNNPLILKYHINKEYPFSVIFSYFEFPLINYSKTDMKEWCEENGFMGIMELTWFCHTPRKSGMPCGVCHPCITVMKEGMSGRMPFSSKIHYHLRILPRIKDTLKRHPNIYARLVALKKKIEVC